MPKVFQQRLLAALMVQAIVFVLYVVMMTLFSEEPFAVTLPLDLAFGVGILITAGVITYVGVSHRAHQQVCYTCWLHGAYCNGQNCPHQQSPAMTTQPTSARRPEESTDHGVGEAPFPLRHERRS
jgi:uncharacterized membrane protein